MNKWPLNYETVGCAESVAKRSNAGPSETRPDMCSGAVGFFPLQKLVQVCVWPPSAGDADLSGCTVPLDASGIVETAQGQWPFVSFLSPSQSQDVMLPNI